MSDDGATTTKPENFRCGYVALVGAPNVGKSTLMNALLGQKLSIVTPRPQTTRRRVLGIYHEAAAQIVFLDTPGLITPKYLLHQRMLSQAASAVADADIVAVLSDVADGSHLPPEVEKFVRSIGSAKPVYLLINKVDSVHKPTILPVIAAFAATGLYREIIPISALKRSNLDDLLRTIIRDLPMQPAFYPDDIVSEHPERFFVAEFIREAVFEQFREEIPYSTAVEIQEFKERQPGNAYIAADIIVERDSQKGILIGRGGAAMKSVGETARRQIEEFLGRIVFLDLHVKVREGWRQDARALSQLGYDEL
ncbi:MAG: GTPase Era [Bacteroidetes bacterium]|nr:GTPase Era [Bacteroidota bacterium]